MTSFLNFPTVSPRLRTFTTAIVFITFCCTQLSAQVVSNQLFRSWQIFARDGYSLSQDLIFGNLNESSYDYVYLNLKSNQAYKIYSPCDQDCDDIDLCLYDEYGNLISCDEESDAQPQIHYFPNRDGRFKLKVIMYNCDIEPCKYGVGVFSR